MIRMTRGFTLVELVITMAIVAILATIAVPAYRDSVSRSNRTEATTTLMRLSQALEKCYTQFSTFAVASCTAVPTTPTATTHYSYAFTARTPTAYTLEATATSTMQLADTKCRKFTIDQTGIKKSANSAGTVDSTNSNRCW